jgi:hypothetical protein
MKAENTSKSSKTLSYIYNAKPKKIGIMKAENTSKAQKHILKKEKI